MTEGVLALDQGSHASRACVFDSEGVLRAEHSVPVATRHESGARVEQDPDELVASLRTAACAALRGCPDLRVQRAGLATQRSTIVCWSRGAPGGALSPALSWQDRRAADWLQQFAPHATRIRELTGLPLSPHYGASKLRWCLEHLPAVRAAARDGTLLAGPLVSWLQSRLCGAEAMADPANASRTLLYDSARLAWSEELLALFGIPVGVLPLCSATRGRFGTLRSGAAASDEAPLLEGIELTALSGDQSAAPFGLGAISEQTLYLNLGTGAFLQQPSTSKPADPAPLLGSVLYADADRTLYTLEGTVNGAGAAVSAFCADRGVQEAELWQALAALPGNREPRIYVNAVGGLGSPWWNSRVESAFLGNAAGDSTLDDFAAVVESIVFLIAANADELRIKDTGATRVLVTGGMSRSDWLCQRLASLLGVVVERAEREASARGIAVLAAPELTAGWAPAPTTRFEPRTDGQLVQRYAKFRNEVARRVAASQ